MRAENKLRLGKMPNTGIDMTGHVIGDLTVVRLGASEHQRRYWLCRCTCGREKLIAGQRLRKGDVTHCGCKGRAVARGSRPHVDFHAANQAAAFADLDAAWAKVWTVVGHEVTRQDNS